MKRIIASFPIDHILLFKKQMLNWANRFGICCFMDSHHYVDEHHQYDCLVAVDAIKVFSPVENILPQLDVFYKENKDWIFGHLGYDLKNEIEALESNHINQAGFEDIFLFVPSIVIGLEKNVVTIHSVKEQPHAVFEAIKKESLDQNPSSLSGKIQLQASLTREEYIDIIKVIQQHIQRGDCYELNYCQEFFAADVVMEPLLTYLNLIEISPTPFSCFYKLNNKYVLCASPERFLSRYGNTIFSQPIKGTAPRNANATLDEIEKTKLQTNEKEKSENVMIVDLVRNDFSKICREGTVAAGELFGIYSFPQVHQMISTIKGELKAHTTFADIIRATFPMGSMTGAPKLRAMQLIEQYEKTKRQLFSGSIGYISPERNFDFNVVIRSIFYNADQRFLNYLVGGAITFYADADKEYEECLLKAKAIIDTLS